MHEERNAHTFRFFRIINILTHLYSEVPWLSFIFFHLVQISTVVSPRGPLVDVITPFVFCLLLGKNTSSEYSVSPVTLNHFLYHRSANNDGTKNEPLRAAITHCCVAHVTCYL